MPKNHPRVPADLAGIASRLAEQSELWSPLIRFDPLSRYYVRLASEPAYEAWLLTWVPGQGTDWHDHGGSAGAFVVVRGSLTEEAAAVTPDSGARVLPDPRHLDSGTLRAFGRKHIHRVTNTELEPAVSVHVYAPALTEMNAYVRDGARLHPAGTSLLGSNW
jgi:predicted metal-dependent enzyme (double-stranded beta helix superfamily)